MNEMKNKGVSFEVILRPAVSDSPSVPPHQSSPTRERPLSQNDIDRKLKDAQERRLSLEASKLQAITKEKERSQDVNQKAQVLNEAFSKGAEKKLAAKMETFEENKRAQELAKLERLKEHERHAQEVRKKRLSQTTPDASSGSE